MMAENLPAWARQEVESICRRFLWAGSDSSVRWKCLVTWPVVARPTSLGGLGVADLKLTGFGLQTRWLWLQKTDHDRAWSALPIQVDPLVQAFFHASISVIVGDGKRTLFWTDNWIDGISVSSMAPTLINAVSKRVIKTQTVHQWLLNATWITKITGGLSVPAITEYLQVWDKVSEVILREEITYRFIWKWTPTGEYTARSACRMLHAGSTPFPGSS
jgi:hypothetical protein